MSAMGELVKAALGEGPDARRRLRQRARFLAHARATRARRLRELAVGLLAAGLGSAAMVAGWQASRAPGGLEPPQVVGGAWVFNEASRVEPAEGTVARVERAADHQAWVVLESGELRCSITSGLSNRWRFEAGGHQAVVRGTRFVLAYQPADDALTLDVTEGAVEVRLRDGRVAMVTPGHPLAERGRPREAEKVRLLEELALGPEDRVMQLEELSYDDAKAAARAQAARRAPKKVDLAMPAELIEPDDLRPLLPEWKRLAEAGRYARAVALIDEQGVEVALAGASSDDLLLLADAARLAKAAPLGRIALSRLRERFEGTPAAAEAAFRLGRLEFDAHRPAEAGAWFDTCVREAPAGPFIAEAMGRRLDAFARAADARAASAAAEYLAKHPQGPYAPLARQVLSGQ